MIEAHHRHRKHKNLIFLLFGVVIAICLSQLPQFRQFISGLGSYGYIGAYFAGLFFTSTFTASIGAIMLVTLSQTLAPFPIIFIGALGAISGDFFMFNFVRSKITSQVAPIYQKILGSHFKKILHSHYFGWTLPVIGALIIASPLPDELGVSLLGISEIRPSQFMVISFASHFLGMFIIITASKL